MSKVIGLKEKGADKTARIPIKVIAQEPLKKPAWIRMALPNNARFQAIKKILRENKLHTVCEEASCPNIGECFGNGTATFMILGDLCTRRCPFCDVGHGRPLPPDALEPSHLAHTISLLKLNYVVITSVDRDDLRDGGADHFAKCINAVRDISIKINIEILVPDFRGRLQTALDILSSALPDVLNHNLETVPRLYKAVRPGADYDHSLHLLKSFKDINPSIYTKSGLMLGLGEADEEILDVMFDLRKHQVDILTIGQYLQPTAHHLPVQRYVSPESFSFFKEQGEKMGFMHVASGPMVRSSYHADQQVLTKLKPAI